MIDATKMAVATDWSKDLRCVLNDLGECIAKTPEACQCKQMTKREYIEFLLEIKDGVPGYQRKVL
jgi:hypothetical protein